MKWISVVAVCLGLGVFCGHSAIGFAAEDEPKWESAGSGISYRVLSVKDAFNEFMGPQLKVTGEIKAKRNLGLVIFSVAVYRNKKLICLANICALPNLVKGDEAPFEEHCELEGTDTSYDAVKIRVKQAD